MVFRRVLFLTALFHFSVAFDFIRDSFNIIDQFSDPCDDFYRHACPRGNYGFLTDDVYDKFKNDFFKHREPRAWDNLQAPKALETVKKRLVELPSSTFDYIVEFYQGQCENQRNTTSILKKLEEIIKQEKNPECVQMSCLTMLYADDNCTRSAEALASRLKNSLIPSADVPMFYLSELSDTFDQLYTSINGISMMIEEDMREGVSTLNTFITDMVDILKEMILETPWLQNYNLEEFAHKLVSDVKLADNFAKSLEKNLNSLMKLELTYLDCMSDTVPGGTWLCLIYAHRLAKIGKVDLKFFDFFNAFNAHPIVKFGYPVFHIAQHSEMAGKLGFSGMVAGHEIAHTLIEDPNDRELFPIYSEPAIQCVQDQFKASCAEYNEEVCEVEDKHIDDNGADILGGQLAYKLLEKYMGHRLKEEYTRLKRITITHQQLFFYAAAFTFCQGAATDNTDDDHGAGNVRINALAQLPGFQDAFNCSSDSRIMQTVEKQCFIFGKDAPAQRRK